MVAGAAAVLPGLLSGCDDQPTSSGTPGAPEASGNQPEATPSTDPVLVAALLTAAGQVQQLSQRYSAIGQTFPALRPQLATGIKHHAAHVAKLKELGGSEPTAPAGKLPAVPKTAAAALAELASREQKVSVAHATAAGKVNGPAARLLAMVAASESQLAAALTPPKKAAR